MWIIKHDKVGEGKIEDRWWGTNVWEVMEEMVRNDIEGKERGEES